MNQERRMWGDVRRRCRWAALAAILLAPGLPAHAAPDGGFLAQPVFQRHDSAADLVWGRNEQGPYTLSRRAVVPHSETVIIDGARAFRLTDYQIDYAKGTIVFTDPLAVSHAARVEYSFDPQNSAVNLRALDAPLSLDLARMRLGGLVSSTLRLNSVCRFPEAQGKADLSAIGVGMDTQVGQSTRVGTLFALSPRFATGARGADGLDASGMQVSAETNAHRLQAKMNFVRTGNAFAAADEYRWRKGVRYFDLNTAYTFSKDLAARSSFQRTDEQASDGTQARVTTATANEVSAGLTSSSLVTVAHRTQETDGPNQAGQVTTTDSVQLDQKLGALGAAQVRHDLRLDDSGDGSGAHPTATTGVKVNALIPGGTRVVAERTEAHTESQDPAISTQVGISTSVVGGLRLEGQYAQREAPGQTSEEVKAARVEASPIGGLKVAGGVVQKETGGDERIGKQAQVEVNSYAGLRLVGRLDSQENGAGRALGIVRSVDARLKPFQSLEIAGTYKEREQADQGLSLTRGVQVSLGPANLFQIRGSYTENPEDGDRVLQEERHSIGLRSTLGPISLTGDYAQRLSPSSEMLARELEVGLAIQVTRYDRLFSAYKVADQMTALGTEGSSEQYRLGYTRWMGGTFGFSLEGEYLQFMEGDQYLPDKSETRAKAGINARF